MRFGGVGSAPYDSFNLAGHVGDDPLLVERNRALLRARLPHDTQIQWLDQVHGTNVVEVAPVSRFAGSKSSQRSDRHSALHSALHSTPQSTARSAVDSAPHFAPSFSPEEAPLLAPQADACWTDKAGVACAIMTADCLPVLLCDRNGRHVAAAHAGWRGLLGGVLDATVSALPVASSSLMAWLGPCIGERAFEVGDEVRDAFLAQAHTFGGVEAVSGCFVAANRARHWFADLRHLAELKLNFMDVGSIYSSNDCTFTDKDRFFSYRRDGETGRMASLILIKAE
jgi:YfiH family protein